MRLYISHVINDEVHMKLDLTFDEVQVIQGVFYQYYQALRQEVMCDVEKKCVESITYKLNQFETNYFEKK